MATAQVPQYTIEQLGQHFKAKYPGAYDSYSDSDLGNQVVKKFPVYQEGLIQPKSQNPLEALASFFAPNITKTVTQGPAQLVQEAQNQPNTKGDLWGSIKNAAENTFNLAKLTLNPKNIAEEASYAIPYGKGANIATKALLPGAISGGLQGATQDNANPVSVAESAVSGAGTAGAMHALGSLLSGIPKLLNKAGGTVENTGTGVLRGQYNVPPAMANNTQLGTAIKKLSDEYGVRNMNDVMDAAKTVTGQDGIVNKLKLSAIADANPVDISGISRETKGILDKYDTLQPTQEKKIMSRVASMLGATQGDNIVNADPTLLFKSIQGLESDAAEITRPGANRTISSNDTQLASAYRDIANNLKDRLFNKSGANDALLKTQLTPEDYQSLHDISPKLAQDVTSAKSIKDLRAIEAKFVPLSKAAQYTTDAKTNKPINAKDALLGGLSFFKPEVLPLLALSKYLETGTGKAQTGTLLQKTGQKMQTVSSPASADELRTLMSYLGGVTGSHLVSGNQPQQ